MGCDTRKGMHVRLKYLLDETEGRQEGGLRPVARKGEGGFRVVGQVFQGMGLTRASEILSGEYNTKAVECARDCVSSRSGRDRTVH